MSTPTGGSSPMTKRRDRSHWLYVAVIIAVILGITVGLIWPKFGASLAPLGSGFVNLIKMMIGPIIFCTIITGIGSVRKAAQVGKVGGIALTYFIVMSLVALTIGLIVGNVLHPGDGLHLTDALLDKGKAQVKPPEEGEEGGLTGFILSVVPETLLSSLTSGSVLQALLVALLAGFGVQALGEKGEPITRGISHIQRLIFKIMSMVMWVAPVGAFGAMASVVGIAGPAVLGSLLTIMVGFYVTCILFVGVVLGLLLWFVARINIFSLLKYLAREFLLIVSTSSSESALPRALAKLEHLGVSRPTVGIVIPTGYSFNLDGTAIYLTMASLFVADAMDKPFHLGEQISLLIFMMIASKGAAGVSGAGLATLAGGLSTHRPDLVGGVGLIVGIDRFMSEARALTNFAGNSVATVVIGTWTNSIDHDRAHAVLAGDLPFDEATMTDDHEPATADAADSGAEQSAGSR